MKIYTFNHQDATPFYTKLLCVALILLALSGFLAMQVSDQTGLVATEDIDGVQWVSAPAPQVAVNWNNMVGAPSTIISNTIGIELSLNG